MSNAARRGVPNAAAALGWRRDAAPAECRRTSTTGCLRLGCRFQRERAAAGAKAREEITSHAVRTDTAALKACATAIFHRLSSLSLQHNRERDGPGVPAVRRALEGVAATGPRSAGRRAELDAVSARASDRRRLDQPTGRRDSRIIARRRVLARR